MSAISQFIPNQQISAATIIADVASVAELSMYALASNFDEVQMFDQYYNQLFTDARIMKANVNIQSKLMDHPVEDGSLISDFRIVLPVEIELSVICTGIAYRDVYKRICDWFLAGWTLNVSTKVQTYKNMMIQAMPRDETPDMFDVCVIALKLREVVIITTQYQTLTAGDVASANDQSTISSGVVAPKTPPPSLLVQFKNWVGL